MSASFIPAVFNYTDNIYSYQNGLGKNITGSSISVTGINLEWLPLNFTTNYSYSEINELTSDGQQFSGWRLATDTEISSMLNSYLSGLTIDLSDSSNKAEINGAFNYFYPYFDDTYSPLVTIPDWWEYGYGYAIGFFDEQTNDPYPQNASALIFSDARYNLEPTYLDGDVLYAVHGYGMNEKYDSIGAYLVRPSEVPTPATAWLFLSGLGAIITFRKRVKS